MKPIANTFYIIDGHVFYSTINEGIDHSKLWQIIVSEVFQNLDRQNKQELANAPYGTDRGRVVILPNKKIIMYGTKGCAPYEDHLKKLFHLPETVKIDWTSDPHYKIQKTDEIIFKDIFSLVKTKSPLQDTHIANVKKGSEVYKKVLEKLKKLDY
jgi:hypothetical protein